MNTYSFRVGDTVKVFQKIKEGSKERTVSFKGTVVATKGVGDNKMFTVRQMIEKVTVDRIFPYFAPTVTKVDVVGKPKKRVRRANLAGISLRA